jgi:glycerophosphoryl diester phosphodiesterase
MAAIRKGIALGVDFVEVDLRRTDDGVLVALHDATVNRTTNGRGRVDRLSLRNVRALDAGSGERIPTLEEVCQAAAGHVGLMLEIKVEGVAQETVEMVRQAGFNGPVIYASFLHDELYDIRSVRPEASLMVLFGRLPKSPVAHALAYKSSHVGLRHDTATRRLVDAFHQEGLLVFVYTADRPRDIRRAVSLGVDGVISNFPERITRAQGLAPSEPSSTSGGEKVDTL